MNSCSFKVYRVYLASLNSVKWSRIFAEVELWMTVSKLKTAGFVQSLEFLKKSCNLPSNFPDPGKVWKIEVKSWKNGKKPCVFLKAVQEVLQKWFFFRVGQILFNLAGMSWKKLCSCVFFLRSLLISYLITLSLEKYIIVLEKSQILDQKSVRTLKEKEIRRPLFTSFVNVSRLQGLSR